MSDEPNRVRAAWDANAEHWDTRMGEGRGFALSLVAPAEERLLSLRPGNRVLDIACGNGLHARRLARRGAKVLAVDLSPRLIELSRLRTPRELDVEYRVVDAANQANLETLPIGFDAAVCHMAVFDIERLDFLFAAVSRLLRSGSPFIVSSVHPCFNSARPILFAEMSERTDPAPMSYGVRVLEYMTPAEFPARAFDEIHNPHPVFHRPLSMVLGEAFSAGFALTGLLEPTFPKAVTVVQRDALYWDYRFAEIPPVVVCRFQKIGAST